MPIKCLKMGSGTTIVGWVEKDPAELLEPKPQADYSQGIDPRVLSKLMEDPSKKPSTTREGFLGMLLVLAVLGVAAAYWAYL